MAAATRTGFTAVGIHMGTTSDQQRPHEGHFTPRVVVPDAKVIEGRRAFRAAIDTLEAQLDILRQAAVTVGEMAEARFWEEAIARLRN